MPRAEVPGTGVNRIHADPHCIDRESNSGAPSRREEPELQVCGEAVIEPVSDLQELLGRLAAKPGSSSKVGGLCVNCSERATCSYPKPPGGVWRCEDYR